METTNLQTTGKVYVMTADSPLWDTIKQITEEFPETMYAFTQAMYALNQEADDKSITQLSLLALYLDDLKTEVETLKKALSPSET